MFTKSIYDLPLLKGAYVASETEMARLVNDVLRLFYKGILESTSVEVHFSNEKGDRVEFSLSHVGRRGGMVELKLGSTTYLPESKPNESHQSIVFDIHVSAFRREKRVDLTEKDMGFIVSAFAKFSDMLIDDCDRYIKTESSFGGWDILGSIVDSSGFLSGMCTTSYMTEDPNGTNFAPSVKLDRVLVLNGEEIIHVIKDSSFDFKAMNPCLCEDLLKFYSRALSEAFLNKD